MIGKSGYVNGKLAYRAYCGEKLIWDLGRYPITDATGTLIGIINYETNSSSDAELNIDVSAIGTATPYAQRDAIEAILCDGLDIDAIPRTARAVNMAGVVPILLSISGSGGTYFMVFGCGFIESALSGDSKPRSAHISYGASETKGKLSTSAEPETGDMLKILFTTVISTSGNTTGEAQGLESLLLDNCDKAATSSCPNILSVYGVTFQNGELVLHEERVIDGYECTDPVASGEIETPTKEMTAQYTYEYSGWSLTDGGDAVSSMTTILPEQELTFISDDYGTYYIDLGTDVFYITSGETYIVLWDGTEYERQCIKTNMDGFYYDTIGNLALVFPEDSAELDTGEPFSIVRMCLDDGTEYTTMIGTTSTEDSHIVAIYQDASDGPLDCITADIILYAAFDAFIRSYTARFYVDSELKSEQNVEYGEVAAPPDITKEGYIIEWVPSDMTIVGDTDFYGVWTRDYILPETNIAFAYNSNSGAYSATVNTIKEMSNGSTYVVQWDNEVYTCVMHSIGYTVYSSGATNLSYNSCLGDGAAMTKVFGYDAVPKDSGSGEPFMMSYYNKELTIHTQELDASHTISIYAI